MAKNSQKYWEQRARQNKLKVIAVGEKGINELKRLLKTNLDDVQGKIKDFYKKYGDRAEEFLTPAELKKYKSELAKSLKKYPKDKTIKKIAKEDIPKYKIDRLRNLETDLQILLSEATKGQEAGIYKTLSDVSKVSDAVLLKTFSDTGIKFNRIASSKLQALLSSDWSGKNWSERLWKDRELVGEKLTEVLGKGIPQGTSLQRMSRELSKLTGEQFNNSYRLVRTESAFIDNSVLLERFKEAKKDLGYTEYIYDAFLDNRTSEICKELDGKRFKIEDAKVGVNFPPMHPNCRSTTQLAEDSIDYEAIDYGEEKEDFKIDTSKDNILPSFNDENLTRINKILDEKNIPTKIEYKDILFKEQSIQRNINKHPELDIKQYPLLLNKALYYTNDINKGKKEGYLELLGELSDKYDASVVIDTQDKDKLNAIVHIHKKRKPKTKK